MSSLTEFTFFPKLPPELRLRIWSLVPQPTRIIGLLPPADVWKKKYLDRQDVDISALRYNFRYISQPRDLPVFPPLHVNREAREDWLRRFTQTRRCEKHDDGALSVTLQFDVPFISYESDIFTLLGHWSIADFVEAYDGHGVLDRDDIGYIDVFVGLDRSLIKHVGFAELPGSLWWAVETLNIQQLPSLEQFSFITLGPLTIPPPESDVHMQYRTTDFLTSRLEMEAVDLEDVNCEVKDISKLAVAREPFFNKDRLRHSLGLSPTIRPLSRYATFVKAWLWHSSHPGYNFLLLRQHVSILSWDFLDYVFGNDRDSAVKPCPLPLPGCGIGGHTRDAMLDWEPVFSIDYKLALGRVWIDEFTKLGIVL